MADYLLKEELLETVSCDPKRHAVVIAWFVNSGCCRWLSSALHIAHQKGLRGPVLSRDQRSEELVEYRLRHFAADTVAKGFE